MTEKVTIIDVRFYIQYQINYANHNGLLCMYADLIGGLIGGRVMRLSSLGTNVYLFTSSSHHGYRGRSVQTKGSLKMCRRTCSDLEFNYAVHWPHSMNHQHGQNGEMHHYGLVCPGNITLISNFYLPLNPVGTVYRLGTEYACHV